MGNQHTKENAKQIVLVGLTDTLWSDRGGLNTELAEELVRFRDTYNDMTAHLFLPVKSNEYARPRECRELTDDVLKPAALSAQVVFCDGIGFVDPNAGIRMAYHASYSKIKKDKDYKCLPESYEEIADYFQSNKDNLFLIENNARYRDLAKKADIMAVDVFNLPTVEQAFVKNKTSRRYG